MHNFDGNACLGLLPEIKQALANFDFDYANPSGIHQLGQKARFIVEDARDSLKKLLRTSSDQRIVFTSGATEANNLALFYPYYQSFLKKQALPVYLSGKTEHPAVLETLSRLQMLGCSVDYLNQVDGISESTIREELLENTQMVSLMAANNETGMVNDIADIFKKIKGYDRKILTHTDAVQSVVKQDLNFAEINADFISLSGHKIGALTGVGALVVNDNLSACPHLLGGPQELGWRAGTENLAGIYSLGIAAKYWMQSAEDYRRKIADLKQLILAQIDEKLDNYQINSGREVLNSTISLTIPGIIADDLVVALDLAGIAISSGSACASGKPNPSHVLLANGLSEADARATIRISLGLDNKAEDCILLVDKLREYVSNN